MRELKDLSNYILDILQKKDLDEFKFSYHTKINAKLIRFYNNIKQR